MSAIEVTGLGFDYGRGPVLHGVDLELDEGDLLAVIGPSGCGKTTLLRLLAGFERPVAGQVRIGGAEVAGGSRFVPANRRRVGLVPQEGALFPHLTVGENIGFALGRRDPQRRHRIGELAAMIGLSGLEDRLPRELSGGQQQRVALARALAPRPALVLLDEPFASLDPATRLVLRRSVKEILHAEKATAVMVTHDREEALTMSDRVAVMLAGSVVQAGTPYEVYDAPASREIALLLGEATFLPVLERSSSTVRCALGELGLAESPSDARAGDHVLIRPEQLDADPDGVPGRVLQSDFAGVSTRVLVEIADGTRLIASLGQLRPAVDTTIRLAVTRPVQLVAG